MFKEGDWVIDKVHGSLGVVLNVYTDGVSARFGGMSAIRANRDIELASLEIGPAGIATMIDLALQTNDEQWFYELTDLMDYYRKVDMYG